MSKETIREARQSLPREYGYTLVNETGRPTLLVRCPRPDPDYNHELADAALYVALDDLKDVTDVLLVGDERTTRMEPLRLRDHIRDQIREDQELTAEVVPKLPREYGYTVLASEINPKNTALALRVPRASVAEFSPEDVKHVRENLRGKLLEHVQNCNLAYVIADDDFERVGRRVFLELLQVEDMVDELAPATPAPYEAPEPEPERAPEPSAAPAPARASTYVDAEEYVKIAPQGPKPATAPRPPSRSPAPAAEPAAKPATAAAARSSTPQGSESGQQAPAKLPPGVKPGSPQARALELGAPTRDFATEVETEEYEVIVSKPKRDEGPRDDPRTRPVSSPAKTPQHDSGASVEPKVEVRREPNADVEALATKFEDMEYEIMREVPVMGHTFDVAAHRHGGKRVLAKRVPSFTEQDCAEYQRLAEDLGADVCVLIADHIDAGARLATWGTRVIVLSEGEADDIQF